MPSGKTAQMTKEKLLELLSTISDPEIPVVSIIDLGILRTVVQMDDQWIITITPTYSGCPAMNMIEAQIKALLDQELGDAYEVRTTLHPAWTTDWMSEDGKRKLKEYGIAPPEASPHQHKLFGAPVLPQCPHCESKNTERISEYGSTACKAMYRCIDCREPFDYFKCH